ncbi:hypothetical protein V1512DRAFT_246934 [Lipomyces arxii]|uniref:uncharacterized protein n=1 Tax=Lipomyces arxii TaxID=56418 RepID=UPI0034CF5C62
MTDIGKAEKRRLPWNNVESSQIKIKSPRKSQAVKVGQIKEPKSHQTTSHREKVVVSEHKETLSDLSDLSVLNVYEAKTSNHKTSQVQETECMIKGDERFRMVEDELFDIARKQAASQHDAKFEQVILNQIRTPANAKDFTHAMLNQQNDEKLQEVYNDGSKATKSSKLSLLLMSPMKPTASLLAHIGSPVKSPLRLKKPATETDSATESDDDVLETVTDGIWNTVPNQEGQLPNQLDSSRLHSPKQSSFLQKKLIQKFNSGTFESTSSTDDKAGATELPSRPLSLKERREMRNSNLRKAQKASKILFL